MQITIGTRESLLALVQSELVKTYIENQCPDAEVMLLKIKTTGDKILDRTLDQIGGKGLFVKELDRALLDRKSDLSVHSLKDLPMEVPEELPVLAFSRREDPAGCVGIAGGSIRAGSFETDWFLQSAPGSAAERNISGCGIQKCAGKCTDPASETGFR